MKYQILFLLKNNEKIFKTVICCNFVGAYALRKHLRDNLNLLAFGWCLLDTGAFQSICLFRELNIC